jgi:hypothetical protein
MRLSLGSNAAALACGEMPSSFCNSASTFSSQPSASVVFEKTASSSFVCIMSVLARHFAPTYIPEGRFAYMQSDCSSPSFSGCQLCVPHLRQSATSAATFGCPQNFDCDSLLSSHGEGCDCSRATSAPDSASLHSSMYYSRCTKVWYCAA